VPLALWNDEWKKLSEILDDQKIKNSTSPWDSVLAIAWKPKREVDYRRLDDTIVRDGPTSELNGKRD